MEKEYSPVSYAEVRHYVDIAQKLPRDNAEVLQRVLSRRAQEAGVSSDKVWPLIYSITDRFVEEDNKMRREIMEEEIRHKGIMEEEKIDYKSKLIESENRLNQCFISYVNHMKKRIKDDPNQTISMTLDKLNEFGEKLELEDIDLEIDIRQSNLKDISNERLEEIKKKFKIKSCDFYIENMLDMDFNKLKGIDGLNIYYEDSKEPEEGLEEVMLIQDKIKELTSGLKHETDFNKFATIYKRIAENMSYDYISQELIKKEWEQKELSNEEKNRIKYSQGLIGLLTRNNSMCRLCKDFGMHIKKCGSRCKIHKTEN